MRTAVLLALAGTCFACGSEPASDSRGSAGSGGFATMSAAAAPDAGSVCSEGQLRCDGGALQVCSSDAWQERALCSSSALCRAGLSAGQCALPVCSFGDTRCEGATPEHCNRDRTGWDSTERCPTPDLCDPIAGRCR